ncbi:MULTISPECIES: hypothetical protein [unclassified Ensifer]|uniref:hypothetical protein n=1 Tax=unclassified Ensifer TaxID=2633371 RepID=UPI0012E39DFA|nr:MULTISPECIES: hypothetical protein [unclassified Ensifer]
MNQSVPSGDRTGFFSQEEEAMLEKHAWMYVSHNRPTVIGLYHEMVDEMRCWNEARATNGEPPLRAPSLTTFHRRVKALPREVVTVGRGLARMRRPRRVAKARWDFFGSAETVAVDSANRFTGRTIQVAVNDLEQSLSLPSAGKPECLAVVAGRALIPIPGLSVPKT